MGSMGLGFRVYMVAGLGLGLRLADMERPGMSDKLPGILLSSPGYFAFIMNASRAFISFARVDDARVEEDDQKTTEDDRRRPTS